MSVYKKFLFLFTLLFSCSHLGAYTIIKNGPVHEAFMTKELGALALVAVPKAPPPAINEIIPHQMSSQEQWIAGYWAWSQESNDFVWVSGMWRKPPPGHSWISGYWKRYTEGWAWIQGFWSNASADELTYIDLPPPERIDDEIPNAPGDEYMWVPGAFVHNHNTGNYEWYDGNWYPMIHAWILVPAHYYWRPGGYVYIPNYWDWPNAERGTVYASISVEPEERYDLSYEPTEIIDPFQVMIHYFPHYPDYILHFTHHYFYHYNVWIEYEKYLPIWWKWQKWWTFTHRDQLALWWWYTHPGYLAPKWLTESDAKQIPPPTSALVMLMKNISPSPMITPFGVVDQTELIHARNQLVEKRTEIVNPIISIDPQQLSKIQNLAIKESDKRGHELKPTGERTFNSARPYVQNPLPKPSMGLDKDLPKKVHYSHKTMFVPPRPVKIQQDNGDTNYSNVSMADYVQVPGPIIQQPNIKQPNQIQNDSNTKQMLPYTPEVEEYNINPSTTQPMTPNPPLQSNQYKVPSNFPENPLPKVDENPYFIPGQTPQGPTQIPSIPSSDHLRPPLPQAQQDKGYLMNRPQPQQNPGTSVNNSRGFRSKDRDHYPAYP